MCVATWGYGTGATTDDAHPFSLPIQGIDVIDWVPLESIKVTVTVTTANVTLSAAQARARYLILSGTLTGNRNVIVPNHWQGIVFCNNAGAYTTTVKTSGGSGIVVGQGKRAILLADGTNVVRVTADA